MGVESVSVAFGYLPAISQSVDTNPISGIVAMVLCGMYTSGEVWICICGRTELPEQADTLDIMPRTIATVRPPRPAASRQRPSRPPAALRPISASPLTPWPAPSRTSSAMASSAPCQEAEPLLMTKRPSPRSSSRLKSFAASILSLNNSQLKPHSSGCACH